MPIRVGAAGGIATPHSAAAAFAMGAAFVVTGSINQGCLEAATSDTVREMLANAGQADVTVAPAALTVPVLNARSLTTPTRARSSSFGLGFSQTELNTVSG